MNIKKVLALLLALTFVIFTFAACGSKEGGEATTQAQNAETEPSGEAVTDSSEPVTGDENTEPSTDENGETVTAEDVTAETKLPETKEEILALYTEVMNQAKKDAPAFNKVLYQVLPDDAASRKVSEGGALVNAALNLAGNFMTSEKDAYKEPEVYEKGGDMHAFPVVDNKAGCLLTDTSAIKSATCEKLPNGNVRITIVLNSEANPEPTKSAAKPVSNHGAIFNPLSKKVIDENLSGGLVSAVFKDITYSLTYHDCSTQLVFNPENNHVVSLDQVCNVTIKGSGKAGFVTIAVDKQELVNYVKVYNIKY